ncbi:sigma-70 family RNA polymerase sigma factor [Geminicoccus roseus]|uniref:sigma-70 family RNA polymerase sigma factor n=1 Tax=Geminicoccus roseus TaxID=404900 RepID=UPI00041967F5|nr:sigma-70 family RNA polymerase sigma factor [Geminicoccus roseus]
MSSADETTSLFEEHRPRLLRLAYRMLGTAAEAEDVVQDAWLRWRQVKTGTVREPGAFLTRVVTRLCLDVMKSARVRRESYVGSWLPEPIVEAEEEGLRLDELTLTLMLALERLSPLERAAFLLHDVFEVPAQEVGAALNRDASAVRQLAVRARRHVRASRPRYPVDRAEGDRIAQAFFQASASGDLVALRSLLANTVVLHSDGGGKVLASLNPIFGVERVLRLFEGLSRKYAGAMARMIRLVRIDGLPGYVSLARDGFLQTTALAIEDGRIIAIYITRNPDKLGRIASMVATEGQTARLQ